jgi:hypothetical protein
MQTPAGGMETLSPGRTAFIDNGGRLTREMPGLPAPARGEAQAAHGCERQAALHRPRQARGAARTGSATQRLGGRPANPTADGARNAATASQFSRPPAGRVPSATGAGNRPGGGNALAHSPNAAPTGTLPGTPRRPLNRPCPGQLQTTATRQPIAGGDSPCRAGTAHAAERRAAHAAERRTAHATSGGQPMPPSGGQPMPPSGGSLSSRRRPALSPPLR